MLYWFPYYSLVGYLIYSRLGKLVVQSLCAAEQYVSSLCSFSNESDNEDKLDEIDTSILKSLRVFQKKMISEEVRKLVEEKIHDKLMINGLKEDNVICKKQMKGLERKVLALGELENNSLKDEVQKLQSTLTSTKENSPPKDAATGNQNHLDMNRMPNIGASTIDSNISSFSTLLTWSRKAKSQTQDNALKPEYVRIYIYIYIMDGCVLDTNRTYHHYRLNT